MIINDVQFNCGLDEILSELRYQLVLNNIQLLRKVMDSGDNVMVQCPYHGNGQERRPSAGISKKTGIFHCFACGEVHELHEVISYCFGHTDDIVGKFGWQWLLKNFATVKVEERKDVEFDLSRSGLYSKVTSNSRIADRNNYNFVTEEELDKYRYYHPYMYIRKLTDEVIDLFDIGYNAETDCITFPVRDINGNCLFVAERSVKSKYFHYPLSAEKPLYGLYEYNEATNVVNSNWSCMIYGLDFTTWDKSEVIVCESMLDALVFWTINKYAVALNGLGTDYQINQLKKLPCRKIILATDNDEAGMKARKILRQKLQNTKIITEYVFPDNRKDANECTKEELQNLIEVF